MSVGVAAVVSSTSWPALLPSGEECDGKRRCGSDEDLSGRKPYTCGLRVWIVGTWSGVVCRSWLGCATDGAVVRSAGRIGSGSVGGVCGIGSVDRFHCCCGCCGIYSSASDQSGGFLLSRQVGRGDLLHRAGCVECDGGGHIGDSSVLRENDREQEREEYGEELHLARGCAFVRIV